MLPHVCVTHAYHTWQWKYFSQSAHKPKTDLPVVYRRNLPLLWETDADIADLDGGSVAEITFPNPNNLTSFKVKVRTMTYDSEIQFHQTVFFGVVSSTSLRPLKNLYVMCEVHVDGLVKLANAASGE